jgi:thiol-disulfide isomerase/thioredoxin
LNWFLNSLLLSGDIVQEIDEEMTKEKAIEVAKKEIGSKSRRRRDAEEKFSGNIKQIFADEFEETIATGVTVILFGMAWCPHCQSDLQLMTNVQNQNKLENVSFYLINCKSMENVNLCFDELANGIPTINTYLDGKRIVKDFKGSNVYQFNRMLKAHVSGGDALAAWKKAEKVRDDEDDY